MATVFPTAYFGSIEYYKNLCRFNTVEIEVQETFPKQTLRNRTIINTANGHMRLTVPVVKPNGSKSKTDELLLSDNTKWRAEHWRAIKTAYSSAPYFDHYAREIEELINSKETNLVDFNLNILERTLSWVGIEIELIKSRDYNPKPEHDFRNEFTSVEPLNQTPYIQVFNQEEFTESLSILDPILCEGPLARNLLL